MCLILNKFKCLWSWLLVPVADLLKVCTVVCQSNDWVTGLNPTLGMDICVQFSSPPIILIPNLGVLHGLDFHANSTHGLRTLGSNLQD